MNAIKGFSLLRLILPLLVLPVAALSQEAAPDARNRQEAFPRRVAVYVTGGVSDSAKTVLGTSLLASLVNTGACVSHERSDDFLATVGDLSRRQVVLDDSKICEIGKQFGIRYICAVAITPAFGAPGTFTVFARMLNTEAGKSKLNGEVDSPLKTAKDFTLAANTVVEKMLGKNLSYMQPTPEPVTMTAATVPVDSAASAPAKPLPPAAKPDVAVEPGKLTVAVFMTGWEPKDAKGVHAIIGEELAKVINESDKYTAGDSTAAVRRLLDGDHRPRNAPLENEQVKVIGQRLGVRYLCLSNVKKLNAIRTRYRVDVCLIDAATADTVSSAKAKSGLKNADEITKVSQKAAKDLLKADRARKK